MEVRNIVEQMLRLPVEFLTGFAVVYLHNIRNLLSAVCFIA
jgi:hypothetical protein